MNSHWVVKFTMENGKGKFEVDYQYAKTFQDIARMIITYKCKRNYHISSIDIKPDTTLFDFQD